MITQQQPLDAKTQLYLAFIVQLRQLENSIATLHAKRRLAKWLGFLVNKKRLKAEINRLEAEQREVELQMIRLRPTNNPLSFLDDGETE
jgi:hypothetical protein